MVTLAAPLPGTTYAGTRWSTLGYAEKVRSQFLSLRHRPGQSAIELGRPAPHSPTNGDLPGELPYWRLPKRRQFAIGDDIFLQSFVLRSFSTVLKPQRRAQ